MQLTGMGMMLKSLGIDPDEIQATIVDTKGKIEQIQKYAANLDTNQSRVLENHTVIMQSLLFITEKIAKIESRLDALTPIQPEVVIDNGGHHSN